MRKYIIYAILLSLASSIFGQNYLPFKNPQSKKWGFKTEKSIVIDAMYEAAKPFYNDYACVKTNKGWGIIYQLQKKYIIEPQFLEVVILPDHNLWVQNQQKMWGIMDYNGTWVQPCQYQHLAYWEWYVNYEKKLTVDYDTILFKKDNIHGLMTKSGAVLKTLPYNKVNMFEPSKAVTTVCMVDEEGYPVKFGIINNKGNEIVPCIYDDLGESQCGFNPNRYIIWGSNITAIRGDSCTQFNFKGEVLIPLHKCK